MICLKYVLIIFNHICIFCLTPEAKTNFPIWEKQKQFFDDDEDDKAELSDTKGVS